MPLHYILTEDGRSNKGKTVGVGAYSFPFHVNVNCSWSSLGIEMGNNAFTKSVLALLTFWTRHSIFVVDVCPVHFMMLPVSVVSTY